MAFSSDRTKDRFLVSGSPATESEEIEEVVKSMKSGAYSYPFDARDLIINGALQISATK